MSDDPDTIGDEQATESIIVPVEIPLNDDVHQAAWQQVKATAATDDGARETIGESVAEHVGPVNLHAVVYQEFCQIKQQRQQAATQMMGQLADGAQPAQPTPPEDDGS